MHLPFQTCHHHHAEVPIDLKTQKHPPSTWSFPLESSLFYLPVPVYLPSLPEFYPRTQEPHEDPVPHLQYRLQIQTPTPHHQLLLNSLIHQVSSSSSDLDDSSLELGMGISESSQRFNPILSIDP